MFFWGLSACVFGLGCVLFGSGGEGGCFGGFALPFQAGGGKVGATVCQ